jgi:hypothetical protein
MATAGNPYERFCKKERLKYQTWYGDTYTAKISVDGTHTENCDITHIQIPFDKERESAVATALLLSEADMPGYYSWLWDRVQNHVKTIAELNRKKVSCVTVLIKADTINDGETKHIYLITPAYTRYFDVLRGSDISVFQVGDLAIKVGNMLRDLSEAGYVHGDMGPNALYQAGEKILFGDFFFASELTETADLPSLYQYYLPAHVPDGAIARGNRSTSFDVCAAVSMLWAILSNDPIDARITQKRLPGKAPDVFMSVLRNLLNNPAEDALQFFRKGIGGAVRDIKKDNTFDNLKFKISSYSEKYVPAPPAIEAHVSEEDLFAAVGAN